LDLPGIFVGVGRSKIDVDVQSEVTSVWLVPSASMPLTGFLRDWHNRLPVLAGWRWKIAQLLAMKQRDFKVLNTLLELLESLCATVATTL
jgi:hypothetical protein